MNSDNANVIVTAILLIALALVGLYDVWAIIKLGDAYSVTFVIRKWSAEFPVLPLMIGVVLGHLFWCKSCIEIDVKPMDASIEKSTIVPVVKHGSVSDTDD